MKILVACSECMRENIHDVPWVRVGVRDDAVYEFTCPKGHKSIVTLQEQRFEVLFEIGAHAIADGYYREAISSFAASLERFYEFYLRAALAERGIAAPVVDGSWKLVRKQSERQLGAFVFVYTVVNGRIPTLLSDTDTAFRNRVIHEGAIPTLAEALAFGQSVLDILRPLLLEAKQHFPEGVQATIHDHMMKAGPNPTTLSIGTIVSLNAGEASHHTIPLADSVKRIELSRLSRNCVS